MKDLTIIIPVHEFNEEVSRLLTRAIDSIPDTDVKIILSCNSNIKEVIGEEKFNKEVRFEFVESSEEAILINHAVNVADTKYFSVLEFDDVYTKNWFVNVEKYLATGFDSFGYLPLVEVYDYTKGENGICGYANEAVWATSFSDKLGYYDIESLQNYFNFLCSGGIFKREEFIEIGGLKASMKLVFWYEFLLRAIYNKKDVFVIPKVGYHHTVNREGSLSDIYSKTISREEGDWWFELANKEYTFKKDREKKYTE